MSAESYPQEPYLVDPPTEPQLDHKFCGDHGEIGRGGSLVTAISAAGRAGFEQVVLVAIIANTAVLVWSMLDHARAEMLEPVQDRHRHHVRR